MKIYTYVDNSNLYIEGCRVSAVKKSLATNIIHAMDNGILDYGWRIDYGRLHEFLCGTEKSEIGAARLWGSPPPGDEFWRIVKRKGFDHTIFQRSVNGKEKKVDVGVAHAMTKDAYTILNKANSEMILVAGDRDYVPVIEDLVKEGFQITVAFWSHASKELREAANFLNLDPHIEHLTLHT